MTAVPRNPPMALALALLLTGELLLMAESAYIEVNSKEKRSPGDEPSKGPSQWFTQLPSKDTLSNMNMPGYESMINKFSGGQQGSTAKRSADDGTKVNSKEKRSPGDEPSKGPSQWFTQLPSKDTLSNMNMPGYESMINKFSGGQQGSTAKRSADDGTKVNSKEKRSPGDEPSKGPSQWFTQLPSKDTLSNMNMPGYESMINKFSGGQQGSTAKRSADDGTKVNSKEKRSPGDEPSKGPSQWFTQLPSKDTLSNMNMPGYESMINKFSGGQQGSTAKRSADDGTKVNSKEKRSPGDEPSKGPSQWFTQLPSKDTLSNMNMPGYESMINKFSGGQQGSTAKRSADDGTKVNSKEKRSPGDEPSKGPSQWFTQLPSKDTLSNMNMPGYESMINKFSGGQQGSTAKRSADDGTKVNSKEKRSPGDEPSKGPSQWFTQLPSKDTLSNMNMPGYESMINKFSGGQQGSTAKRSADDGTKVNSKEKRSPGDETSKGPSQWFTQLPSKDTLSNMNMPGYESMINKFSGGQQGSTAKRSADDGTKVNSKEKRSPGDETSKGPSQWFTQLPSKDTLSNMNMPGYESMINKFSGGQQGSTAKRSADDGTKVNSKEKRSPGDETSKGPSQWFTQLPSKDTLSNMNMPGYESMINKFSGGQQGSTAKRSADDGTKVNSKEKRSPGDETSKGPSQWFTQLPSKDTLSNMNMPGYESMINKFSGGQQGSTAKRSADDGTKVNSKEKRSPGDETSKGPSQWFTQLPSKDTLSNMNMPGYESMINKFSGGQQGSTAKRSADDGTKVNSKEKRSPGDETSKGPSQWFTQLPSKDTLSNMNMPGYESMINKFSGGQQGSTAKRSADDGTKVNSKEKRSPGDDQSKGPSQWINELSNYKEMMNSSMNKDKYSQMVKPPSNLSIPGGQ